MKHYLKQLIFTTILVLSTSLNASWLDESFFDPTDGYLDMSERLLEHQGFLPVPIVITEPAIGYGGGASAIYFHNKLGESKGNPPSISAIAAAATENGTWFVGGGHMGIWKDDHIRYVGGAAIGLVKMDFYGLASGSVEENTGVSFETEFSLISQELQFRLWDSDIFAGIGYLFLDTTNTFSLTNTLSLTNNTAFTNLPGKTFDNRSAAVSLMLNYDNRDNMLTPTEGIAAEIKVLDFNENWGSDQNYQKYSASVLGYTKVTDNLILALRANGKSIKDEAPFYAYPYIDMRGVKAMQYQGDETMLGELEARWALSYRWALIGFTGAGKAFSNEKSDSDTIYSKGIGFRYLVASKLGLQVGMDIAKGDDDTVIYIQVGSSWSLK